MGAIIFANIMLGIVNIMLGIAIIIFGIANIMISTIKSEDDGRNFAPQFVSAH